VYESSTRRRRSSWPYGRRCLALVELRRYAQARGWQPVEYVDTGVSGSKDRRPALDQLTVDVRRHAVDAVVC